MFGFSSLWRYFLSFCSAHLSLRPRHEASPKRR